MYRFRKKPQTSKVSLDVEETAHAIEEPDISAVDIIKSSDELENTTIEVQTASFDIAKEMALTGDSDDEVPSTVVVDLTTVEETEIKSDKPTEEKKKSRFRVGKISKLLAPMLADTLDIFSTSQKTGDELNEDQANLEADELAPPGPEADEVESIKSSEETHSTNMESQTPAIQITEDTAAIDDNSDQATDSAWVNLTVDKETEADSDETVESNKKSPSLFRVGRLSRLVAPILSEAVEKLSKTSANEKSNVDSDSESQATDEDKDLVVPAESDNLEAETTKSSNELENTAIEDQTAVSQIEGKTPITADDNDEALNSAVTTAGGGEVISDKSIEENKKSPSLYRVQRLSRLFSPKNRRKSTGSSVSTDKEFENDNELLAIDEHDSTIVEEPESASLASASKVNGIADDENIDETKEPAEGSEEAPKATPSRLSFSQFTSFISRLNEPMNEDAGDADIVPEDVEEVSIVLRPINFHHSSREIIQRIGAATNMAKLQKFLLLQHWGIKVGEHYYHLHIVEEKKENGTFSKRLAVSLSKFDNVTVEFPVWQTSKSHVARVNAAIKTIKSMGKFTNEDDVEVFRDQVDLKEQLIPDEERKQYASQKKKPPKTSSEDQLTAVYKKEYHIATNNCIMFSARYFFRHIFDIDPRTTPPVEFRRRMAWVATKWREMGCGIDRKALLKMFISPLGLLNPMRILTKTGDGNLFIVRLALVFMGKVLPEGVEAASEVPSGVAIITEHEAKEAGTEVEKKVDAAIEQYEEEEGAILEDSEIVEDEATDDGPEVGKKRSWWWSVSGRGKKKVEDEEKAEEDGKGEDDEIKEGGEEGEDVEGEQVGDKAKGGKKDKSRKKEKDDKKAKDGEKLKDGEKDGNGEKEEKDGEEEDESNGEKVVDGEKEGDSMNAEDGKKEKGGKKEKKSIFSRKFKITKIMKDDEKDEEEKQTAEGKNTEESETVEPSE
ncbi:hypothetical protein BDQ17DRAFT_1435047 [Cyathus striatus]|nr:hypothetical protein BDQ17DRAFT_1435047 [Cyathus striatus]